MVRVNDDGAESHPFKRLGISEPFSSTDPASDMRACFSGKSYIYKDLLFVTRNGDG